MGCVEWVREPELRRMSLELVGLDGRLAELQGLKENKESSLIYI